MSAATNAQQPKSYCQVPRGTNQTRCRRIKRAECLGCQRGICLEDAYECNTCPEHYWCRGCLEDVLAHGEVFHMCRNCFDAFHKEMEEQDPIVESSPIQVRSEVDPIVDDEELVSTPPPTTEPTGPVNELPAMSVIPMQGLPAVTMTPPRRPICTPPILPVPSRLVAKRLFS